nr:succinate dehydrogenase [ubiquinone] flavoprotein subunit 1, mitochondrial [Ipomoea batatas]
MQRVMQNNAAVFRTQETLEEGRHMESILFCFPCTVTKRDDEKWMKHTLGYWENEKVRLEYRPVHMNTLDDEIESFPPKARVY